jgi:hypothetical protein
MGHRDFFKTTPSAGWSSSL